MTGPRPDASLEVQPAGHTADREDRRRRRATAAAATALVVAGGSWAGLALAGWRPIASLATTGAAACSIPTVTVTTGAGLRATTLLPGMAAMSGLGDRMVTYGIQGNVDQPRIEISLQPAGPLAPPVVPPGPIQTHPVLVDGRPALAGAQPGAGFLNVYWQLEAAHDASMAAWNMTEAQAVAIAAGVVYNPGTTTTLPAGSGPTITAQKAETDAGGGTAGTSAVLTAWSEWAAIAQAPGAPPPGPPAGLEEWHPVWVVAGRPADQKTVTVVDATGGRVLARRTSTAAPRYLSALTDRSTTACPGTPLGVLTRSEVTYLAATRNPTAAIAAKLAATYQLDTAAGGELTQCQFRPCATSAVWVVLARGGSVAFSSPGVVSQSGNNMPTTTLPPGARWSIYPLNPVTGNGLGDSGTGQGPAPAYFGRLTDLDPPRPPATTGPPAAGCRPVPIVTVSTDTAGGRWYTYAGGATQVIPPPGFDPAAATDAQLRRYGFPPRPPAGTRARQLWDDNIAHAKHPAPPGLSTCPRSAG